MFVLETAAVGVVYLLLYLSLKIYFMSRSDHCDASFTWSNHLASDVCTPKKCGVETSCFSGATTVTQDSSLHNLKVSCYFLRVIVPTTSLYQRLQNNSSILKF